MTSNILTQVSKSLAIETVKVAKDGAVQDVALPVDRFFIIDVSGSMYASMREMASNLKRIVKETTFVGDLVTIAWFSDSCGMVCERFNVQNQSHIQEINKLIDDNLYARGCTSFVPVINKVKTLAENRDAGYASALCFMSDGHDNCNSRDKIFSSVEEIAPFIDRSAIIEYGWYADSKTLHAMADRLNASYLFAQNVDELITLLEAEITASVRSVPSIEVSAKSGLLMSIEDGRVFKVENGKALVPENIPFVYGVVAREDMNFALDEKSKEVLYALLSVYVLRHDNDTSLEILSALGDVRMFVRFSNAFSKQDYVVVSEGALQASKNANERYLDGYSEKLVPDVNATCVLDVLKALNAGNNQLNLTEFTYRKIGRSMLKGADVAMVEMQKIQNAILGATDPAIRDELFRKLASVASNAEGLQFVSSSKLVSMSSLTFSNSRPNVSILISEHGSVAIPADKAITYKLPSELKTVRFRNFAVVADGIVNVSVLPVVVDQETFARLKELDVVSGEWVEGNQIVIDVSNLPVINRSMVEKMNSIDFVKSEVENASIKGHAKVVNYYLDYIRKELGLGDSHRSSGLLEKYSPEAVEWLKENGLTDGGFAPRSLSAPTQEEIQSYTVKVSIKGMSSLPKVEDVVAAIKKGTNAPKFAFMIDSVREILPHVEGKSKEELRAYLPQIEADAEILKKTTQRLNNESAINKFILIVGKAWFADRDDREAFSLTVDDQLVTIELKETTIKI